MGSNIKHEAIFIIFIIFIMEGFLFYCGAGDNSNFKAAQQQTQSAGYGGFCQNNYFFWHKHN